MPGLSYSLLVFTAVNATLQKIATIVTALLAACAVEDAETPTVPGRWYSQAQVDAGRLDYETYCVACHGADGSATPDWRTPGPDGHYPPPPLDGSAHAWHHPLAMLDDTIRHGGARFGGVMPGFGALLDKDQRLSIVAYIQNWWPEEIYARWEEIDARGR